VGDGETGNGELGMRKQIAWGKGPSVMKERKTRGRCGLRRRRYEGEAIGAIGAYAPEGRGIAECGVKMGWGGADGLLIKTY